MAFDQCQVTSKEVDFSSLQRAPKGSDRRLFTTTVSRNEGLDRVVLGVFSVENLGNLNLF